MLNFVLLKCSIVGSVFMPGKKFTFILLSGFSQTIYSKLNEVI